MVGPSIKTKHPKIQNKHQNQHNNGSLITSGVLQPHQEELLSLQKIIVANVYWRKTFHNEISPTFSTCFTSMKGLIFEIIFKKRSKGLMQIFLFILC